MIHSEQEPRPPVADLITITGGMTTVWLLTERLPLEALAAHQGKLTAAAAAVTALALIRLQVTSQESPAAEDLE